MELKVLRKFDFKTYQEQIDKLPKESSRYGFVDVNFIGKNGNQFEIMTLEDGFVEREIPKNENFIYYREYTKQGDLQVDGKYAALNSANNVHLGKWNTYSNGKLVKSEDNEIGFKINYEKVLEICKSKKIDLTHRLSSLSRSKTPQHPFWYVSYSSGLTRPSRISSKEDPVLGGIPETIIKNLSIDGESGGIKELANSGHIDN
jgi:hypothetical protein